jgi:uncharacterized alkaline shock family protein YloU
MRLMERHSHIASDVLARYASDAAREVPGVNGLVGRHGGVRIEGDAVELHVAVEWGVPILDVGAAVQQRVADYLARMADLRPSAVDVVVDGVGSP